MTWWPEIAVHTRTLIVAIAVGLPVGLLAAYSLMYHRQQPTPFRWWAARLLLWPFLALGCAAAASACAWSGEEAAFYTAISSLFGQGIVPVMIEGLQMMWRSRFGDANDIPIPDPGVDTGGLSAGKSADRAKSHAGVTMVTPD
ncbi:hypothetical protein KCG44_08755 [Pacificimonas sp. WHA3]|uniref:Uncharacterized protein n=1 Tax=Pacificimonas pallii TaxID=2827236 RepID=A0ABS6SER5_9SPHN|nr:hypothetical protein [Pacificimonas pallii]MBV7256874.1 hypothetical protein [Pacificimonas pallii]